MAPPADPPPPADDSTESFRPPTGVPATIPRAADAATGDASTLPPLRQPPPTDPDECAPPDAGRYRPVRFHRKGGMGRVFVARDTELNRDVALKDIQPRYVAQPDVCRKFEFEAQITGTLEHPGVVPVYGKGRSPADHPFYVMRFIDGQSLAEAIRAYHTPPADPTPDPTRGPERAAALRGLLTRFVAVCQAVAYAHSRGIIHRDIKPANIMLGPFGETLIVDWGLAKRIHEPHSPDDPAAGGQPPADAWAVTRTLPGARLGTAAYWAPEQARGEPDKHDERTDVYGLGAVLFEILTGQPPNAGGVLPPAAPSPRDGGAAVDDELDEIVRTALARDPDDRQQSAADLARQVDWWLGDQPVAGQRAAVRALEAELERDPGRRDVGDLLARQRANLGLMYRALDQPMRAAVAFAYAVRWYEQVAAGAAAHPRDVAELANCRVDLAECFDALGLAEQAAEERQAARALFDRLIATHSGEYRANYATIIMTRDQPPARPAPAPPADQTADTATLQVPEPAGEPELVQGYTVQQVIGLGAFGRVLLARDNALDRLVAIKEFGREFTGVAGRRFLREMQALAALQHPNIVTVYTYGLHSGSDRPFLVMEYVEGRDLADEVRGFYDAGGYLGRPTPAFARLLNGLAQACDAAHYAHSRGIVHRDPKPHNILLRADGTAKLIDFGLVKLIGGAADEPDSAADGPTPDASLTMAGQILGTPAYMAPEQIANPERVGPATDIFVLGAGLFFVLTGRPPGDGPIPELLTRLARGQIPRPRDVRPDVPAELDAICARAMAFRPEDRYPTAAALADDLRMWLAGKSVTAGHRGRFRRLWDQLTGRR
jgi:serine/threonine protein kinase